MTGRIAAIQRHPIKSHGREALENVTVAAGGTLPFDRHWAVAHEAARLEDGAWGPCNNFSTGSKAPKLTAIDAVFDPEAGRLTLTHPERPAITFRPDDPAEAASFLDWVRPLCPPERAAPVRIVSLPGRGLTDTDYPSVSLISLTSNAALSEDLGASLSPLRWRANVWLEGLAPFAEREWGGRRLRLGTATLEITEPQIRCLATAANPETGVRDADTLGAMKARHGDHAFGVYARVIEGGSFRRGDSAVLLP